MGKTKRKSCEEVLAECETQLRRQREPLKELRKEMRQTREYLGTVNWEYLEDA